MDDKLQRLKEKYFDPSTDPFYKRFEELKKEAKDLASTQFRLGGWTQTFSGKQFWPLDPIPTDIKIVDIAHALSLVNRYNGHTPVPYSVAQHSVLVSLECDPVDAFWGLMHDASEAFIGDVISPLKRELPEYQSVEKHLMGIVCNRYGMDLVEPPSVKKADLTILAAESRDLFPVKPADWKLPYPPAKRVIKPVGWRAAQRMFLKRFEELWPEHQKRKVA
jgi:uncharacterized protein